MGTDGRYRERRWIPREVLSEYEKTPLFPDWEVGRIGELLRDDGYPLVYFDVVRERRLFFPWESEMFNRLIQIAEENYGGKE